MLLGFCGRSGSGKTTAANYLKDKHQFCIFSFSTPLKAVVSELFDISLFCLSNSFAKNQILSSWGKTPREILQIFGTECVRDHFGQDFWVNHMRKTLLPYRCSSLQERFHLSKFNKVIDDCRFPEEISMVSDLGGYVVHIERPDNPLEINQSHSSEQCDFSRAHHIINNDSDLITLYNNLDTSIRDLKNKV